MPQPVVCTEPIGFGCLFVLISPAPKRDRLENPQPPESQVGVIRRAAPFVWIHFNSTLTFSSPLSQEELDLRCDSRDGRKIFSLLRLCFKCRESIKLFSSGTSGLKKYQRAPTIFTGTSLSPMSAKLTSKGDTNDTSCICSSPFQPFAKEGFRSIRTI